MYQAIFLIPLMFGIVSDSSWQTTFCNISLLNSLDILHCDQMQDTLMLEAGTNTNINFIPQNDTIKFSSNAVSLITSNDTTYSTVGGSFVASESSNHLWFVSDGSILIEFLNYTGGIQ